MAELPFTSPSQARRGMGRHGSPEQPARPGRSAKRVDQFRTKRPTDGGGKDGVPWMESRGIRSKLPATTWTMRCRC
jgi:hypothetical protein